MSEGLIALLGLIGACVFAWLVIRADAKDQAAYDRWYNNPRHVWNQWRRDDS